jgi:hypothetical protein
MSTIFLLDRFEHWRFIYFCVILCKQRFILTPILLKSLGCIFRSFTRISRLCMRAICKRWKVRIMFTLALWDLISYSLYIHIYIYIYIYISSSLSSKTLVGFVLINCRWAFSAGRFYRVLLPAARQTPNLEENQGFRAFQLSPQEAPSIWSNACEPSSGRWNYGR